MRKITKQEEIMKYLSTMKRFHSFKAVNINTQKVCRCLVEDEENVFVFAKRCKRSGYRYTKERFADYYSIIFETDEDINKKWQRRMKRAVKCLEESGLWEKNKIFFQTILDSGLSYQEKKQMDDIYWKYRHVDFVSSITFSKPNIFSIHFKSEFETCLGENEYLREEVMQKVLGIPNCLVERFDSHQMDLIFDVSDIEKNNLSTLSAQLNDKSSLQHRVSFSLQIPKDIAEIEKRVESLLSKYFGEYLFRKVYEPYSAKYPFMFYDDDNGDLQIDTRYIWEFSECNLKSMYFGKYQNSHVKEEFKRAIEQKRDYHYCTRTSYDVSLEYNAAKNMAWYSEEYRNCGNGHYYIALDHSTALFVEDD